MLGIAALMCATATAVVIVLMSQRGDRPLVTPLREETAAHQQRSKSAQDAPSTRWLITPAPRSQAPARRAARLGVRKRESSERRGDRRAPRAREQRKHERTRRARARNPRPHRGPTISPAPPTAPVSAPTQPGPPPTAAEPVPTQEAATQPTGTPRTVTQPSTPRPAGTPETRPIEIEIEDGELENEIDRVRSHGGHVRVRIRSDEFVLVEVEDHELSWSVPAGGVTLIEFDAPSGKSYEIELHRHKGLLVLRFDD